MAQDSDRPDVVFVSYDEPNAEENFARLRAFAPDAKRVHGVEGIYNAHVAAANLATTPRFFLVDGDNWILDGFAFRPPEPPLPLVDIYLWRSRNAVNGLTLMNGCVKYLTREAILSMKSNALDFSVSMQGSRHIVEHVASETRFNSTPFLAWRCGFRECVKLSSGMVDNPNIPNILKRWQTVGGGVVNGDWCMLGARMGVQFGTRHAGKGELRRINDMAWLKARFAEILARRPARRAPS